MYAETAEAFSESHVERLFLFAVIWGCGGPLDEELQVEFSNILKKLTNGLPDDDSVESVFEYYVDESGEWDVWQTWWVLCVHGGYCVYVVGSVCTWWVLCVHGGYCVRRTHSTHHVHTVHGVCCVHST